jgi:hypothetical protein
MQRLELSADGNLDEVRALVAALQTWEDVETDRSLQNTHSENLNIAKLAALLHRELTNISILTAVTASIANALERGTVPDLQQSAISDFCPVYTSGFETISQRLLSECQDAAICEAIRIFVVRLTLAKQLSQISSSQTATRETGTCAGRDIVSDAWRRTCAAALQLNHVIEDILACTGGWHIANSEQRLTEVLEKAEAGETPCIGAGGHIEIPGWAERRREKRYKSNWPAVATIGGRSTEVSIQDASRCGLGMTGSAEIGQNVTLTFPEGRKISGSVVWSHGGRFGLRLDLPLPPSHVLLAGR